MQSLGVMLECVGSLREQRSDASDGSQSARLPASAGAEGSAEASTSGSNLIDVDVDAGAGAESSASAAGRGGAPPARAPIVVGGIDVLRVESMSSLPREVCRKVLQRDYSLIIETTPLHAYPLPLLDPECDTTVVGLPGIELQLPWTKIALQEYSRAGPSTLVIPAGTRLLELPEPLRDAEFVAVWPWSCKSGPSPPKVVRTRSSLPILNGYLVSHAIMAQRMAAPSVETSGRQPSIRTASIPLPVHRAEGGGILAFRNGTWEAMEIPGGEESGCVRSLIDGLALNNTIGVLEVAVEGADGEGGTRWVPHDLFLGIPLYLTKLCRIVLDRALEDGIFTVEGLALYNETVSKIRTSVRRLIRTYAISETQRTDGDDAWDELHESAQPRSAILIVRGEVREYPLSRHAQGGLTLQDILFHKQSEPEAADDDPVEPAADEFEEPEAEPEPGTAAAPPPAESLI